MRVIFFGTPPFAAKVLAFLLENQIQISAVVTKVDKPKGRSGKFAYSTVKKYVLGHCPGIPLLQPGRASNPQFFEGLSAYLPDLFIVVAYGEIFRENLLQMPRLGCINVHTSLLPKYRGAAPMQFALLNGDRETGVTIMEMTKEMDAGDIIAQKTIPITEEMNLGELEEQLYKASCKTLLRVIRDFERGAVKKFPQDHSKATYVGKIDSSMAHIIWTESADALHNRIRAFSPKPGAWCLIQIGGQIKRLKILHSRVCSYKSDSAGKTLVYDKKSWVIACGKKALQLVEVQLEGKKRMQIADFLRGHPSPPSVSI